MRRLVIAFCTLVAFQGAAFAQSCPGNPDAIGTSRTITIDPASLPQVGRMQYATSLPLEDHEVVLTFDDGPLPPYTSRILDILAENCVKVDYFLVGRMATAYPALVRRIYNAGHVIGTHSLDHPLTFNRMGEEGIARQVDGGIAAVDAAVGDPRAVAPFFRVPGLLRSKEVDTYLASRSLTVWSADEVADDWRRGVTAKKIVKLALQRIEAKGHRGVLLLHDIHPATVLALPMLLKELKARGYKVVQAVPSGERPPSVPELATTKTAAPWPRTLDPASSHESSAKRVAHHHRAKHKHARQHSKGTAVAQMDKQQQRVHDGGWFPSWQ
jgi:peptidoglycan/xylan/chitin deacetylase (PgdA/CDA1 family)